MVDLRKESVIVTCENGHSIIHRGGNKKGKGKLEIPNSCVRCRGKIVKVSR